MNSLRSKVSVKGFLKTRIIAAIIVVFIIVFAALCFGIFRPDPIAIVTESSGQNQRTQLKDNTQQLLNEINETKLKVTSSHALGLYKAANASATVTKSAELIASNPAVAVPPIISSTQVNKNNLGTPTDELTNSINTIKLKYKKSLLEDEYNSLTAKSLVFTNQANNNSVVYSSSLAVNNKSNVSAVNSSQDQIISTSKQVDSNNKYGEYLDAQLEPPRTMYEIKAGSIIPATMISGINSDLPGQVTAFVRQNIYNSTTREYLLVPQGSRLVGLYDNNITYGQQRLLVAWNRLIYPNGNSINLKAMPGSDLEGYAGFYDQVDNKYWQIFGSSFIIGVITAAMQYSQNNTNATVQINGVGVSQPTVGQTLAGSLGQQLGQTGIAVTQKNLNVQPTLIIRPNYPFNIMVTADIILKPYNT